MTTKEILLECCGAAWLGVSVYLCVVVFFCLGD